MFSGWMLRWIALTCCATVLVAQSVREQAVRIPVGNVVEVRLSPKGKQKVKGQLLAVSEQGLTVRIVDAGAVKERAIAFDEIQSLAHKKENGHVALKILAGVGITLAALWVIAAIALGS